MHYSKILLVRAEDADTAEYECNQFMEEKMNEGVCDYFNIISEAVPLKNYLSEIKERVIDLDDYIWEMWEKAKYNVHNEDLDRAALYARKFSQAVFEEFNSDTQVYDITERRSEHIPLEHKNYWAIEIDMHN